MAIRNLLIVGCVGTLLCLGLACRGEIGSNAAHIQLGTPNNPSTAPTTEPVAGSEAEWRQKTALLKGGVRSFKDDVYTVTMPRTDLWVQAEMGEIPTAAGIESRFYFFRCTCGKGKIVGEFVLADYEVNDVIDSLRAGQIDIVSISPMFMYEKPRIQILRFQGEGETADLAKTIQTALNWTGDVRTGKQPLGQVDSATGLPATQGQ